MTHGQQAHLVALDGRGITTAQLFAMNEKWHREHDEVPVKVETRRGFIMRRVAILRFTR